MTRAVPVVSRRPTIPSETLPASFGPWNRTGRFGSGLQSPRYDDRTWGFVFSPSALSSMAITPFSST